MTVVFNIFSDGGSFNNGYKRKNLPQFTSCGCVICLGEKVIKEFGEPLGDNTISYGELQGMMIVLKETIKKIESLERNKLPKPYNINVHSDSQFVIKGASEWLYGWKKRNWKNNTGEDVSYKEIWQELYKDYICNPDYNLNFIHVKGHTKNTDFKSLMNEKCDKLATDLVKQFKEENNLL